MGVSLEREGLGMGAGADGVLGSSFPVLMGV